MSLAIRISKREKKYTKLLAPKCDIPYLRPSLSPFIRASSLSMSPLAQGRTKPLIPTLSLSPSHREQARRPNIFPSLQNSPYSIPALPRRQSSPPSSSARTISSRFCASRAGPGARICSSTRIWISTCWYWTGWWCWRRRGRLLWRFLRTGGRTGGIGDCSGLLGLAGWFCLWMMQCWKRRWLMGWCSRRREVVGVGMIAGALPILARLISSLW